MALNKSNKSTPSSRSGYFCELTASTGKQNNFLLPVRIKVTPNNTIGSLSDGKKNNKMLQPVLIKDLFQSSHKERLCPKITSVSTQKKKPQRSIQSYLTRQSYYKPKKEEVEESGFFNRKSYDGRKVRRQLYQTLDNSQKSVCDSKNNTSKHVKLKKCTTQNVEERRMETTSIQNKHRQSFLLPLNTIKNSFLRKSTSNLANTNNKQNIKSSTATVDRRTKCCSSTTEEKQFVKNTQKSIYNETEDNVDIELDFSSSEIDKYNRNRSCISMRDNSTMTSPTIDKITSLSKSLSNVDEFEKQSITTNTSKLKSEMQYSNNINSNSLEVQNPSIEKNPDIFSEKSIFLNKTCENTELNLLNPNNLDCTGFIELKSFLEQSIQTCEDQTMKLKQALNVVNNMLSNTSKTNIQCDTDIETDNNINTSNTLTNSPSSINTTDIVDTNLKNNNIVNQNRLFTNACEVKYIEEHKFNEENLQISINTLVISEELKKINNSIEALNDLARLSTIGEVSNEFEELNKDRQSDSESIDEIILIVNPSSPNSPKTPKSLPNRSTEDSFILLENELNVKHSILPSKSLPASPTKYSITPAFPSQWDKKVERPLKEYMNLKMNGTFLVTPDVKRFQSCLETTDTPHSRKSLSRKIFMELCDLYAESPNSD